MNKENEKLEKEPSSTDQKTVRNGSFAYHLFHSVIDILPPPIQRIEVGDS